MMALHILNANQEHQPKSNFGDALHNGLQQLAQHKMGQIQQRQQHAQNSQVLKALGFPHPEALAHIPVETILKYLEPQAQQQATQQMNQQSQQGSLQQLMNSQSNQQPQQQTPQRLPQSGIKALQETLKPQALQQVVQNQPKIQSPLGEQPVTKKIIQHNIEKGQLDQAPAIVAKNTAKLAREEVKANRIAEHKEHQLAQKEQAIVDKETFPLYKDINSSYKASKSADKRLDRMEKLIDNGKLTNPVIHSFLKTLSHGIFGFGLDLHSLENADAQEFHKLSNEFLKDAKDVFGNRLTNLDVESFLKMVPSLTQSDEGKRRIIYNLKAANKANELKKHTMDQIIKENNGHRPRNLEEQIDERAGTELDKLAAEFTQGAPQQKRKGLTNGWLDI